jgi:hypothetical protein
VIFPAEAGGWLQRKSVPGMDREDLHEVPLRMGFNTGIPGAPKSATGASDLAVSEIRLIAQHNRKKGKITCLICNLNGCVGRCRLQSVGDSPLLKSA